MQPVRLQNEKQRQNKAHFKSTHESSNNTCEQCDYKTGKYQELRTHIELV